METSPVAFVQTFYDWYVPASSAPGGDIPWARALKTRAAVFGPDLARAVQADVDAQTAAGGEVAALDFDPFLNSQDPCDHYAAGSARAHGAGYAVDVYGVCDGTRNAEPDVVAELVPAGGTWQFANFRYPNLHTDLMRKLKAAGAPEKAASQ